MIDAPHGPGPSQIAFASELVKLLLQVVQADHQVTAAESEALLAFARRSGLHPAELLSLQEMLEGRATLSPPNLGLLKGRRTEVLRAVKEILLSDQTISAEEEEVLAQISTLLS